MGLLDRVHAELSPVRAGVDLTTYPGLFSAQPNLLPWQSPWDARRPNLTWKQSEVQEISQTLPGYYQAISQSPPAFAAQMVRAYTLSQARFIFRDLYDRHAFGKNEADGRRNTELRILETPWSNGTTADLISQCEWHAGLAGNAYILRQPERLRMIRPDWLTIVYGSMEEPDYAAHAIDGVLLGYVYQPGGPYSKARPVVLMPEEMAHWSPIPDPTGGGIGVSWLTAGLLDVQGDISATDHKINFFKNAATPNMVVRGLEAYTQEQVDEITAALDAKHSGTLNAYKTWYLFNGADASVVGSSLREMDFKSTQGAGETRISVLSRVPASYLGLSEGLAGSSLNAGNFGMARRVFGDWVLQSLASLAASLSSIINVPSGAELWTETADIAMLREDAKDAADIVATQAQTIYQLVREGFTGDSAVRAVIAQDLTMLVHTGLVSVQLQAPGTWHGVQDAPAGPVPAALAAETAGETHPTMVKPTPAQAAIPGGPRTDPWTINVDARTFVEPADVNVDARTEVGNSEDIVDGLRTVTEVVNRPRQVVKTVERDANGDIVRVVETEQD